MVLRRPRRSVIHEKGLRPETARIGKRGTFVISARLRRRFRFEEGSLVIVEATSGGVLIRPAAVIAVEHYTPERRAEFLLSNAADTRDYRRAVAEVRKLGVDPDRITHRKSR